MAPGERYTQEIRSDVLFDNPNDDTECVGSNEIATITFAGLEAITVPAGTFRDCARLEIHSQTVDDDEEEDETDLVYWFARGVGIVKAVIVDPEYGSVLELLSWSPR